MRFPPNDIISHLGDAPRFDPAASVGPNLRLAELLGPADPPGLGDMLTAMAEKICPSA